MIGKACLPLALAICAILPVPSARAAVGADGLTPACRVAKAYSDLAGQNRFSELSALFAEKVDYVGPDGTPRTDRAGVAAMYEKVAKFYPAGSPIHLERISLAPLDDDQCFLLHKVVGGKSDGLVSINHFVVGPDGKITWFRPYFQQVLAHYK